MTTVHVQCDSCGTVRQAAPGAEVVKLRLALNKVGWACNDAKDQDLCSRCREAAAS